MIVSVALMSTSAAQAGSPVDMGAAPEMLAIPAGPVSREKAGPGDHADAGLPITVEAFSIDRTEVTAEQYAACVAAKACSPIYSRDRRCNSHRGRAFRAHPVNCVTWRQADSFCRWRGARLPTSEQWERAARGGDPRKYPWGNQPPADQLCWQHESKAPAGTCPVGAHPTGVSPFGVLDMAGNVAEWTATERTDTMNKEYVIRGGGFAIDDLAMAEPDELDFRADKSSMFMATVGALDLGFRCAKTADGEPARPGAAASRPGAYTPTPGSPERKLILDVVRAALKAQSDFKVTHLRVAGDVAYFEGHEHSTAGPTPPTVRAILKRAPDGHWQALETCSATQESAALVEFRKRVADRAPELISTP